MKTKTKPEKGQTVRQIHGPCQGQIFLVEGVDGNLLHVRLLEPGQNHDPEWSHWEDYILTSDEPEPSEKEEGPEPEYTPDVVALAKHLDCEPSDLTLEDYKHYGLDVYSRGSEHHAIGTNDEAQQAVTDCITESVWSFRSSFLASYCDLPEEVFVALHEKCEDANDTVLELIKKSGGIEDFVESAVRNDGRGQFLSQYNGNEYEDDGYYFYRIS